MNKKLLFLFPCLLFSTALFAKSIPTMKVPAGTNIPALGMALDASYDPITDDIVPGFKILSVVVANNSMDVIQMDRDSDEWTVVTAKGARHEAILDLRKSKTDTYLSLPEKLRSKLEYPMMVQVGETRVIDLLFKDSVQLDGFRSVKFTSKMTNRAFNIVSQD